MGKAHAEEAALIGEAQLVDYAFGVEVAIPHADALRSQPLAGLARSARRQGESKGWRALRAALDISNAVEVQAWDGGHAVEKMLGQRLLMDANAVHARHQGRTREGIVIHCRAQAADIRNPSVQSGDGNHWTGTN